MGKTLAQIESYVKSKVGENDHQKVYPALLRADINFAVLKVQQDLIGVGAKFFDKITYNEGNSFNAPSDMLSIPDAIETLYASTGIRSTGVVISSSSGTIRITALEPSEDWNTWTFSLEDTGSLGGVELDYESETIYATYNGSTTTNQQMVDLLNSDPIFSNDFVASTDVPAETMTDGDLGPANIDSGSGSGWVICRELTSKQFGTIRGNFYQEPDAENPAYLRWGSSSGLQKIRVLPKTVTYTLAYYFYRLAEMIESTDTTGIPDEYEELVLLYSVARTYETLRLMEDSADRRLEYQKKREEYEALYDKKFKLNSLEDRRKQASDQLS